MVFPDQESGKISRRRLPRRIPAESSDRKIPVADGRGGMEVPPVRTPADDY